MMTQAKSNNSHIGNNTRSTREYDKSSNVLVVMASTNLGGPGRGLMQLLEAMPLETTQFYVADFKFKNQLDDEFHDNIRSTGWPIVIIPQQFSFDLRMFFSITRIVRENRIDILQSHGYKEAFLCLWAKFRQGKKWIAFFHGYTAENLKVRIYQTIYSIVLRFADAVAYVSPSQEKLLIDLGVKTEQLYYLPNAIDKIRPIVTPPSWYGRSQDNFCVCVVGRLSSEKGHRDFISAFKIVVAKHPFAKAWFLGEGPLVKKLQKQVDQTNLEKNISFAGYVPEARNYFHLFDTLVMPSLSEGMPNVLLEALAAGLPTVSTLVGAVPWIIEHGKNGLSVPASAPEQLATNICLYIEQPELRQKISIAGRRVARKYTVSSRLSLFQKLYSQLRQET